LLLTQTHRYSSAPDAKASLKSAVKAAGEGAAVVEVAQFIDLLEKQFTSMSTL